MNNIEDKLRQRPLGAEIEIIKDQIVDLPELETKGLLEFWVEQGISALTLVLLTKDIEGISQDHLIEICEKNIESMRGQRKTFQKIGQFYFINFNFRNE